MLNESFAYSKVEFNPSDKGVLDFLLLDTTAGLVNVVNDADKYEVVLKFDAKLKPDNKWLNGERDNLFRIDFVLDNVTPKLLDKTALTWKRLMDGATDRALYQSLRTVLDEDEVKPSGVLYSYYLKFGPFGQE